MAQAETKSLIYDAGDDETFDITFDQNITGWTIYFDLILNDSSVISKEITDHDDAISGETSFDLLDTETEELSGNYSYEIRYQTDTGEDETFLKGTMTFT